MSNHYFICYEPLDGADFAEKLYDALAEYEELPEPWLDTRCSFDADDFQEYIGQIIGSAEGLIFVLTPKSKDSKICRLQWKHALENLKPIIPIRFDTYSELPFRLKPRIPIEFGTSFESGFEILKNKIEWLRTEDGIQETVNSAILDAKFALRAPNANETVLNERIKYLEAIANSLSSKANAMSQPTIIQNKHVFISYCHKDFDLLQRMKSMLSKNGIDFWNDEKIQQGTDNWEKRIALAIEQAGCVIAILSPDAKKSKWVSLELSYAEIHNIRVFPILARGDEANAVPIRLILTQRTSIKSESEFETELEDFIPAIQNYLQNLPKIGVSY